MIHRIEIGIEKAIQIKIIKQLYKDFKKEQTVGFMSLWDKRKLPFVLLHKFWYVKQSNIKVDETCLCRGRVPNKLC